jgi:hypothetical protein
VLLLSSADVGDNPAATAFFRAALMMRVEGPRRGGVERRQGWS